MNMQATELAFDDQVLARRARTTLAATDVAMLFTGAEPGGRLEATVVEVTDDDGEPVLAWAADSAAARTVGDGRIATLMLSPSPSFGVRLTLSGRLTPHPDGRASLRVEQVLVGCPYRGSMSGHWQSGTRQLSLADYALAEPDHLAAGIPRLVRHLNTGHAEDLLAVAVRLSGQAADAVAGAAITDLSADGVELDWVDATGGHQLGVSFATPVTTMTELGIALRSAFSIARSRR